MRAGGRSLVIGLARVYWNADPVSTLLIAV
jgi:hypothetical protein